jgi:hypothetical protein
VLYDVVSSISIPVRQIFYLSIMLAATSRRGAALSARYHRHLSSSTSTVKRDYQYFDNFEMKDGIGIVRLNGPAAVNTISPKMQSDVDQIFNDHVIGNKDLKGLVFISSKKDNFIAGADIDMIKETENKADLKEVCMKGHQWWKDIKEKTGNMPFVAALNGSTLVLTPLNSFAIHILIYSLTHSCMYHCSGGSSSKRNRSANAVVLVGVGVVA